MPSAVFDPLIDAMAPHDTPEKVHALVTQSLREFIAKNPAQIGRPDPVRGRIPINFPEPMRAVRNAADWVAARTANVERLPWSKTCAECHTIETQAAHQLTSCTSCHAAPSRAVSSAMGTTSGRMRDRHSPGSRWINSSG